MKKIVLAGLISAIALIALSGCNWATSTQAQNNNTTQKYTDSLNGVSFEYPLNWNVKESEFVTTFSLDSDVLLEREKEGTITYNFVKNTEDIDLNENSDWEGIPNSGEMAKKVYIQHNGSLIIITAYKTSKTDQSVIEKILNDIVSSVSFN